MIIFTNSITLAQNPKPGQYPVAVRRQMTHQNNLCSDSPLWLNSMTQPDVNGVIIDSIFLSLPRGSKTKREQWRTFAAACLLHLRVEGSVSDVRVHFLFVISHLSTKLTVQTLNSFQSHKSGSCQQEEFKTFCQIIRHTSRRSYARSSWICSQCIHVVP